MKYVKIVVVVIMILFTSKTSQANLFCNGIGNAFEALEIHDYFKAKKLFYKNIKRKPAASAYGLSIIYSRNNNPFYNLDSALFYVKLSEISYYQKTSEKNKIKIKLLGVDTITICALADKVDALCFESANQKNSIVSYNHFIKNNSTALQLSQAIQNRNQLAYNQTLKVNTSYAYKNFIATYPNAKQVNDAKARYDKQLFKEYTIDNSLESNVKFLQEQPQSFYTKRAQENVYEIATKSKTVSAYYNFIKQFPNNPSVPKAWRNIYNLSTQIRTPQNIKKFLKTYPDYPYKEELEQDYILANTQYFKIQTKNKWGFVNDSLELKIKPTYEWVSDFSEGAAAVMLNEKVGFINKNNTTVIAFDYDEAEPFVNGLAIVGKNDKYGLINRTGEIIVPIIYDEIGPTNNEFISIELNEKYGFIDTKGNLKVGLQYQSVGDFNNGIAYVKQNDKYGIIDTNLYYVIKPKYEWIDNLENDFIRIRENNLYGVIDAKGNYIVKPIYSQLTEVENGLAMVVKDSKYGYIKSDGSIAIPIELVYQEGVINWGMFNKNKYARVITENKFGMIDTLGNKFMPALFEDVGEMNDDLIAIKRNGSWGYCDYDIKLRIPYNYDYASGFTDNMAIVKKDDLYGVIDKKGSYIIEPIYEEIEWFKGNLLLVKQNGLYGLINLRAEAILPIQYVKIEMLNKSSLLKLYTKNGFIYKKVKDVFSQNNSPLERG